MLKFKNLFFIVTFSSLLLCLSVSCHKDTVLSDPNKVTDTDGNVYQTVEIGDQWWTKENLKVTHYRNGDPIPNVTDASEWADLTTGAYCNFNNDTTLVATYGRLYNWYAVTDSRNIAPPGWHVPTDDDWKELEIFLGMSQADADKGDFYRGNIGNKLKASDGWLRDGNGTNESGFTALPAGLRAICVNPSICNNDAPFDRLGDYTLFWSRTTVSSEGYSYCECAWDRYLDAFGAGVGRYADEKGFGFSVRLVRDR